MTWLCKIFDKIQIMTHYAIKVINRFNINYYN